MAAVARLHIAVARGSRCLVRLTALGGPTQATVTHTSDTVSASRLVPLSDLYVAEQGVMRLFRVHLVSVYL